MMGTERVTGQPQRPVGGAIADRKLVGKGLHRTCSLGETLDRILPLAHHFGISRIADITGLDRIGIPVMIAMRPNARSIAVSQGKGPTADHAKASAVMEAIEIWHAEHFCGPVYFATQSDLLADHRFGDLDRFPRVAGGQEWGPHLRMHWVAAVDLMSGRDILVPLEMVTADFTHPLPSGAGVFASSTNGLASGNHPLEAICHGICEVIERDALSLWHHLPLEDRRASRVDCATIDDPAACDTIAKFVAAGLDCAIWDVTSNVGVATFMCIVREADVESDHLGLGSGTHPDRATALQRALTEAAQTRLNYISGAREDISAEEYGIAGRAAKSSAFAELFAIPEGMRTFEATPTRMNTHLQADVDWLLDRLGGVGIVELAVVDLTRAEFGIPVVRVIIPGLEAPHDDDGYMPGSRARALIERGGP
jgi:ribosomal protein S12 methylthiotransferase accessory factor